MAKKKTNKKAEKKLAAKKSTPRRKGKPKTLGECFVMMPFGGYFDRYYIEIFLPAIEQANLVPRRADDIFRPSTIVKDIWELTRNAQVILAELSTQNANVFYELGLAHAISKPVVMVTESMSDVPFDLRALRVLVYDKNHPAWGIELQKGITEALKETLEAPKRVLPAFFEPSDTNSNEIHRTERSMIELERRLHSVDELSRQYGKKRHFRVQLPANWGDENEDVALAKYLQRYFGAREHGAGSFEFDYIGSVLGKELIYMIGQKARSLGANLFGIEYSD